MLLTIGISGVLVLVLVIAIATSVSNSGTNATPGMAVAGQPAQTDGYTTTRPYPTTTRPTTPTAVDPLQALAEITATDFPRLKAQATGSWIAQISSKSIGLVADGKTYGPADILADHQRLRVKYPDAGLLYTDEWPSFTSPGYWVTVAGPLHPTAQAANTWCDQKGFPVTECFARLMTFEDVPYQKTVHRK